MTDTDGDYVAVGMYLVVPVQPSSGTANPVPPMH